MTHWGRSLRRQASVLLFLWCLGTAYTAPASAQTGPAPDAGSTSSQTPKPDPAPSAPAPDVGSPQPPAPVQSPPPAPALVQPPASAPTTAVSKVVAKRETARKPVRKGRAKQTARQALPTLGRKDAGSVDTTLLIGGLALLVLVISDTVFLTLSTRGIRDAR
jgi:hypothetical protein